MPQLARMKVSIFTTMPKGIYSGGRYLSLILAYSISRAGTEVTYITDNEPLFRRDFIAYEKSFPITTIVTPDFILPEDMTSDWVVIIPTGSFNAKFYDAAINHARATGARIALLCFETPNWYAELSPFPRSPMPTESWRQVVATGGLVITIAEEGIKPAQRYFGNNTDHCPRRSGYWHPPVNDLVAKTVSSIDGPRRNVAMFVRTEDQHKGAQDLLTLPPDIFTGTTLSLIFGRGVDEGYVAKLQNHLAPVEDFFLEVMTQITDKEKFQLLARSQLLLFPSYFEGYGYPPVEAAWFGVPTVAYDLPLLREVAADAVWAAPLGNQEAFANLVRKSLRERKPGPQIRSLMRVVPDTLNAGKKFLALLQDNEAFLPRKSVQFTALKITDSAVTLNADANDILGHHSSGVSLYELKAAIESGKIIVSGFVEGIKARDKLQFDLPLGSIASEEFDCAYDGMIPFMTYGLLDRWPDNASELFISMSIEREKRGRIRLGQIRLKPDWPALLANIPDGGTLEPQDSLVFADPAEICRNYALAATLCEIVGAFRRKGHRISLITPESTRPESPKDDFALDLLPRFDAVVHMKHAQIRDFFKKTLNRGGLVGITRNLRHLAGLDDAPAISLTWPNDAVSTGLLLVSDKLTMEETRRVVPDACRWGRKACAKASLATIVLISSNPEEGALDERVNRLIKKLETTFKGLRLITVGNILHDDVPLATIGRGTALEKVSIAQLSAILSERDRIVGLRMDVGEAPLESLLHCYRVPVVQATDSNVLDEMLKTLLGDDDLVCQEGLAGIVSELLPRNLPQRSLASLGSERDIPILPSPAKILPLITQGDVLSLSGTRGQASSALISGWAEQTLFGARIAKTVGKLGFRLEAATRQPCAELEVMLHVAPATDPHLTVRIVLNGHRLATLRNLRAGASQHRLSVPSDAWRDNDQYLLIILNESSERIADTTVTLMALWPCSANAGKLESLPDPGINQGDTRIGARAMEQSCKNLVASFGKGCDDAFINLVRGWSEPEEDAVYSSSAEAEIEFRPPLATSTPMILRLEGRAFAPQCSGDTSPSHQKIQARYGQNILAETTLMQTHDILDLPLPASVAAKGLASLVLTFPGSLNAEPAPPNNEASHGWLALERSECRVLSHLVSHLALVNGDNSSAPPRRTRIMAAPGALRIVGTGPVSEYQRIMLSGCQLSVPPVMQPDGKWEAVLPIDSSCIQSGETKILYSGRDGPDVLTPTRIEVWSEADSISSSKLQPLDITFCKQSSDGEVQENVEPLVAPPSSPKVSQMQRPTIFDPTAKTTFKTLLGKGWSDIEEKWSWSSGPKATLTMPYSLGASLISMNVGGFIHQPGANQLAVFCVQNVDLATLHLTQNEAAIVDLVLPPACSVARDVRIALPRAVSPMEAGLSDDLRQLALRLFRLEIEPLPPALFTISPDGNRDGVHINTCHQSPRGLLVSVCGAGTMPYGISIAGNGGPAHLIAHVFGSERRWQAVLLVPANTPKQDRLRLDLFGTRVHAENCDPSDSLILPLPDMNGVLS